MSQWVRQVRMGGVLGLIVLVDLMTSAGCGLVIHRSARWEYILGQYGPPKLGEPEFAEHEITIPVTYGSRVPGHPIDSAVCQFGSRIRTRGHRIRISIRTGICKSGAQHVEEIVLERPARGTYEVVYDDQRAGYPLLVTLTVP